MYVQISILSVLIPYLAQSASAFYTISYFSRASAGPCRGAQLRCHNYPDLQCCAAPPHRESFVEAGVTSSGRPGVVLFHDTDITGHCLGCTGGGSINRCIENQPFEPISVVDPQGILEKTLEIAGSAIRGAHCITLGSHSPSFFDPPKIKERDMDNTNATSGQKIDENEPGSMDKSPDPFLRTTHPQKCAKVNMATIDGRHYHLEDHHVTDEFVKELVSFKEGDTEGKAEFAQKWGLKEVTDEQTLRELDMPVEVDEADFSK